jgi:hypothetical protein
LVGKNRRLLTNERKNKMGMGTDRCDYCGDLTETILHALRDWAFVRPLWMSVVDISLKRRFFQVV